MGAVADELFAPDVVDAHEQLHQHPFGICPLLHSDRVILFCLKLDFYIIDKEEGHIHVFKEGAFASLLENYGKGRSSHEVCSLLP